MSFGPKRRKLSSKSYRSVACEDYISTDSDPEYYNSFIINESHEAENEVQPVGTPPQHDEEPQQMRDDELQQHDEEPQQMRDDELQQHDEDFISTDPEYYEPQQIQDDDQQHVENAGDRDDDEVLPPQETIQAELPNPISDTEHSVSNLNLK